MSNLSRRVATAVVVLPLLWVAFFVAPPWVGAAAACRKGAAPATKLEPSTASAEKIDPMAPARVYPGKR